ncbi:MAG: sulfite exporter TauE/SafE family protein [Gammaproteobacteria bacterium]|nr:sulfite exporter TauE/SafE family protein [Gammaproteobacteria bacterium]
MIEEMSSLVMVAFALGLIHALDADHIIAVSVLSSDQSSLQKSLRYALKWSTGHALILLSLVAVFEIASHSIASSIQNVADVAERLVGLLLIILGILLIIKIKKHKMRFHFHRHQGMAAHLHWHAENDKTITEHQHEHKAYFVGGLHGVAGSASLLALIPVMQDTQFLYSIYYIGVFSVGVFIAMVCFGGAFGFVMEKLNRRGVYLAAALKIFLAAFSIVVGWHLVSR